MAKELPYFKFYPAEWIKGRVTLCSHEAQGLFINICAFYWLNDGNICSTDVKKRFNNCSKELQELINENVFKIKDDQIIIPFLEEQLTAFGIITKKRRLAGITSGKVRMKRAKKNICSTHVELIERREEKRREDKTSSVEDEKIKIEQFDSFWELYPRKAQKGQAFVTWQKLCKKAKKDKPTWKEVKRAIIKQKKSIQWENKNYIPHGSTWVNQARWMDDPKLMTGPGIKAKNTVGYTREGLPPKKHRKPDMEL